MRLRAAWCAPLLGALLLVPWPAAAQEEPLRFLGELDIPNKSVEIDGTTVGGLSGLAYDARRGVYYVICDDRGDFAPAAVLHRAYRGWHRRHSRRAHPSVPPPSSLSLEPEGARRVAQFTPRL